MAQDPGTGFLHRLVYQSTTFTKDRIGRIVVCSDRLFRRVRHAYFYPALDPPLRHSLPVDQLDAAIGAQSAAEVVRLCHDK